MSEKILSVVALLCLLAIVSPAQDIRFTQQYAARLHQNPAYAGISSEYSFTTGYRNQWPALKGIFSTNYLSADLRFKDKKSAIGLTSLLDESGDAGLTRLQVGGIYAYHTDISDMFSVSAGLGAMYGRQRLDYSLLIFGDQFDNNGLVSPVSQEVNVYDPVNYISFALGGVLFTRQYWLGVSAHNINQPELGFEASSQLHTRININTGYRFYISSYYSENKFYEFSVTPIINYLHQGNYNATEIGLHTKYTPVSLGLVYKGLSFSGNSSYDKVLAVIAGLDMGRFKGAYSYDIGISGITAQTGGAHELSVTFEQVNLPKIFKKQYIDKKYRRIACPAF